MVTIIADNYYGYCKKEVKTQISFAANLYGMCEEEHAGGAIAFPAYVLGQQFYAGRTVLTKKVTFNEAMGWLGDRVENPAGRLRDRPAVSGYLLCSGECGIQRARRHRSNGSEQNGEWHSLTLRAGETYVLPVGHQDPSGEADRRNGMASGGIARRRNPLPQALHGIGRRQIGNLQIDRQHHSERSCLRQRLRARDGAGGGDSDKGFLRLSTKRRMRGDRAKRPILSAERSLGSVIKLMTPSPEYTDEHNAMARDHSADGAAASYHREALLPAGLGR